MSRGMSQPIKPHVMDVEAWTKHFENMIENRLPYTAGFQRVRNSSPPPKKEEGASEPVKLVNPTQAGLDQAREELKRESGGKVYVTGASGENRAVKPAKRRRKPAQLKDSEQFDDVLSQP